MLKVSIILHLTSVKFNTQSIFQYLYKGLHHTDKFKEFIFRETEHIWKITNIKYTLFTSDFCKVFLFF